MICYHLFHYKLKEVYHMWIYSMKKHNYFLDHLHKLLKLVENDMLKVFQLLLPNYYIFQYLNHHI